MAPKRSGVKTRLLALACCYRPDKSPTTKCATCWENRLHHKLELSFSVKQSVTDLRARLTGSQHPAGSRRFFIILVLKFIWHKAQKLLEQKLGEAQGALPARGLCTTVTGINQSINPSTMAAQRCGSETSNLTVGTGANHREKNRHPTILPLSHNVWLVC